MAKKKKGAAESGLKVVHVNKKARFNYEILEKFEAGIVLTGAEIKSIREGKISLGEAYVSPKNEELFLHNSHIPQYTNSNDAKYNPNRVRKLLMHKREIKKLQGRVEQKGLTIVPTRVYLEKGRAKLEIALARGKDAPDKRKTIKERELNREAQRAMKS